MTNTSSEKFGKDHWNLLAYVETCCVDSGGELHRKHMRCNEKTHALLQYCVRHGDWDDAHSTRLNDGSTIPGHDDWDCLEDLEEAGLIDIVSLSNGFVRMKIAGQTIVAQIRHHKVQGGTFSTFKPFPHGVMSSA